MGLEPGDVLGPTMAQSRSTRRPSMVDRAKNTSRASSIDGSATKAPRFGTSVTSPSRSSAASAARTRARLTAKISESCSSFRRMPGRSRCSAIAVQIRSWIVSAGEACSGFGARIGPFLPIFGSIFSNLIIVHSVVHRR
jgi:hypothetical protein